MAVAGARGKPWGGALAPRRDGCREAGRPVKQRLMMIAIKMPAASASAPPPRDLLLPDPAATERLGRALARLLRAGDVVALYGDLGAGKTALARAVIRALPGPEGAAGEEVPSPTFTLVQTYEREPAPVWHFDLYRIEDPEEIEELGLSEALAGGITLIEWPQRLGARLPAGALAVTLTFTGNGGSGDGGSGDGGRRARLAGGGDWTERLAELRI